MTQAIRDQRSANMQADIATFIIALKATEFTGDIESQYGQRLVSASDNSIYQVVPDLLLFPRNNEDVAIVLKLLNEPQFQVLSLTTRGGGTGTNGQSLNRGIILDLSRHLNQILHFDEEKRLVTVQTGVVKDQLNAFLRPLGYFFAPELSTSNRATIGGMINTDASGQGSCEYGKTSQHVRGLHAYSIGGELITTGPHQASPKSEALQATLSALLIPNRAEISAHFPPLNRFITGYDLDHFTQDHSDDHNDDHHNGNYNSSSNHCSKLNHILCGSEGTLAVITEATLNVLPIPKATALVLISYDDFIKALEDAPYLMQAIPKPTSIEVIDNIVMEIAKNDFIWATTEQYFTGIDYAKLKAIQLVEFNADDEDTLTAKVDAFMTYMAQMENPHRLSIRPLHGKKAVNEIYGLRKRAVGLLGAVQGNRRPIPFVEDTAVPPENLAPFITEFRAILDKANVRYGMFGHADAGVIHVRPALDLKLAEDRPLIRAISDQVFALCMQYGGALWGEHGKGVRSEYAQSFFGKLYPLIQQVKATFDPHNQLNPGKIASPHQEALLKIDEVPLRADFNQQIHSHYWAEAAYQTTLYCNGNGACFNYDLDAAMCPSYKATRERIYSPKGRAELIKEWLRQRSHNIENRPFEAEVYQSLSLCLSCKSCAGECPIKVNIPAAKSQFLAQYYQKHPRPLHEKLLISSEKMAVTSNKVRSIYNFMAGNKWGQKLFAKAGLVDLPKLERANYQSAHKLYTELSTDNIQLLAAVEQKENAVVIVPDSFFMFYDATTFNGIIQLLNALGIEVFIAPYQPSGKVAHVYGALKQFEAEAMAQHSLLEKIAGYGIALVGIEPPITLTYREEYPAIGLKTVHVALIQEWLNRYLAQKAASNSLPQIKLQERLQLLSHCTEKTNATHAPKAWQQLFAHFGLSLELVKSGCCGMSGGFGHIKESLPLSEKIYQQSWAPIVADSQKEGAQGEKVTLLATGSSCRTQVKRFDQVTIVHPLVKLQQLLAQ
ncbi:FAD-binding and (Fe-S)-binding domain-containing protein [Ignatzschineria larvae DSM 13226]|uniref:FAD-binding and (Fe-S)-binding domain-containing protein n=1 Tax=Ignatzschineria larvae DSM 13226 TaxID=1111732 RepID=A0ABZ3C239_9GAMM|nr:FAD-binding and (Fe-S)-binding domain-containing protein [Ignatzschineria larvae]